jgi:hypothetical protein
MKNEQIGALLPRFVFPFDRQMTQGNEHHPDDNRRRACQQPCARPNCHPNSSRYPDARCRRQAARAVLLPDDRPRAEKTNPDNDIRCDTPSIVAGKGKARQDREQARPHAHDDMRPQASVKAGPFAANADHRAQERRQQQEKDSLSL